MESRKPLQRLVTTVLASVLLTTAACDNGQFKQQIADFGQAVQTSSTAIGTYFTEINHFERKLYFLDRQMNPDETLAATEHGRPTPLLGVAPFRPESIKARTDAIDLIGLYAKRLAELAGTDAPARFAAGATVLGNNLNNLSSTFASLAGDPTARNFAGPIGTIIGVFGRMILESKRDKALQVAIYQGAPAVRIVLDQLQSDLSDVISPQRQTGTQQALAEYVNYYNRNRASMSMDQRQHFLDSVQQAADQYQLSVSSNPAGLVQSMKEAHEALVKFASSPHKPKNLAELVAALETFKDRAQIVATAVQQLNSSQKR